MFGILPLILAANALADTLEERKEAILRMEETAATTEQLERKTRSESRLKDEGVPILPSLPVVESEVEARVRAESAVEERALCLLVVALKGEGLEQEIVDKIIADYELDGLFSPKESEFISSSDYSMQDRINATWRYESAWIMLWALGFVDELDRPDHIVDVPRAVTFMRERSVEQFRSDAVLRPVAQILDEADLIYRYHWAVVDARVNSKDTPAGLEGGVVYERHYSLNWLIGYMDQEWDEITTDT